MFEAGKEYEIIAAPAFAPDLKGKRLKPAMSTTGEMTRGRVNPEAVLLATPNGGALFFRPEDVRAA